VKKALATALICVFCLCSCGAPSSQDTVLRKFPYPYKAMFTIQSHIDGSTVEEFEAIHTFLNEYTSTPYGYGLGLDIADSLWLYNANDGTSYAKNDDISDYMTWFHGTSTDEKDKAKIVEFYKKGWIDSLHSFGDFSRKDTSDVVFTRELALQAWDALKSESMDIDVWINHGNAANTDNFGGHTPFGTFAYQAGDDPKSDYYHTDLSVENGIRFVWNSHNSDVWGTDDPLFPLTLRDGSKIWGFNAYTGNKTGLFGFDYTWTPLRICEVLTKENLDTLVENSQYAVFATHFGSGDLWEVLNEKNLDAFRLLQSYRDRGDIMVVRSSRLLRYAAVHGNLVYETNETDTSFAINIVKVADISGDYIPRTDQLRGITFYIPENKQLALTIDGKDVPSETYRINPADETGKISVSFNWYWDGE